MNRIVYRTDYYAVEENTQKEIVVMDQIPESAAVVAVHQGCLLLVCQHREAVNEITWELPGGTVKTGEERTLAVKRELEEEAGVLCKDLTYMSCAYPMASLANRCVHYYFTDDLKGSGKKESNQEDDEDVTAVWVPLREVYRKMKEGSHMDAMVGHGLLLSKLYGFLAID
ncbi:NUDIX hydrolase [Paenibacillus glucanolyticus]|jgi:ADP-ribose pyrophosphatase|uniref:NUDIX hydrolase n=1 Tax=Paenibacillus TaxID=44249 RepID=UPI0003E1CDA8|nr:MULTISPECIES: NUDIX hydrolase [Paenibacillus]ANA81795.1 NUDIX hydrolase [Paenibacillus glucanolyticus]AVV59474.1 NUDIX hydrolase [Paenibacillus glucanolyticus]ETT43210.1 NUDIX hydrolase [Paenibacillus sp. FSL R5-808]MPY15993.1 NUDIX hydrolase [Paenibacillus glucanolyticus]